MTRLLIVAEYPTSNASIRSSSRSGLPTAVVCTRKTAAPKAGLNRASGIALVTTVLRLLLIADGARKARLYESRIVESVVGFSKRAARGDKTGLSIDENLSRREPSTSRTLSPRK